MFRLVGASSNISHAYPAIYWSMMSIYISTYSVCASYPRVVSSRGPPSRSTGWKGGLESFNLVFK